MSAAIPPINVFVSRPTLIDPAAETAYKAFHKHMGTHGLILRRLGQSDYSRKAPLKAVINIVDQCCGAIVMGYPQVSLHHEYRRGADQPSKIGYAFPTPWNQIEGALAYRCKAAVLVVAQAGISGGVFDHGVTGECVLHIDMSVPNWFRQPMFSQPLQEWLVDVRACAKERSSRSTETPDPAHVSSSGKVK